MAGFFCFLGGMCDYQFVDSEEKTLCRINGISCKKIGFLYNGFAGVEGKGEIVSQPFTKLKGVQAGTHANAFEPHLILPNCTRKVVSTIKF